MAQWSGMKEFSKVFQKYFNRIFNCTLNRVVVFYNWRINFLVIIFFFFYGMQCVQGETGNCKLVIITLIIYSDSMQVINLYLFMIVLISSHVFAWRWSILGKSQFFPPQKTMSIINNADKQFADWTQKTQINPKPTISAMSRFVFSICAFGFVLSCFSHHISARFTDDFLQSSSNR